MGTGFPSPSWSSDMAPQRGAWPWLAGILVLALVVDLVCFRGYTSYDDRDYFEATARLVETGRLGDDLRFGKDRLVLLGWNCLVASLFGLNAQLIAGSYVCFHLALIVLTFLLGRRAYGRTAGLIGAYYVATVPLIILYSTSMYPDLPLACFVVSAVLAFSWGYERKREGRRRAAAAAVFGAGVSVGLAYCTKETGLLLLPFFFTAWLWNEGIFPFRFRRKAAVAGGSPVAEGGAFPVGAAFAAGFFVIFAAEAAIFSMLSDRPFFRLGWTTASADSGLMQFAFHSGFDPVERFRHFLNVHNGLHFPASLKALLLASALLYPLLRRRQWLIPLCGLWLFVYMMWGSMSLRSYFPPSILPRYLIVILPPACLVLAGVSAGLLDLTRHARAPAWAGRPIRAVAIAVLAAIPLWNLQVADRFAGRPSASVSIANAARAIEVARGAAVRTKKPIVLSFLVGRRLQAVLYGRRPTEVLLAEELSEERLDALLASGGFYYVADNRALLKEERALERWRTPVDDAVLGILLARTDPWDPWSESPDGNSAVRTVSAGPTGEPPGRGEYELAVVEVASFAATPSRLAELGVYLFKDIPPERTRCDPIWTVDLYHVMSRRRPAAASPAAAAVADPDGGDSPPRF